MKYSLTILVFLCFLSSCKPVTVTSKNDLSNAGIDSVTGISSSTITIDLTGVEISSPTINVNMKAFDRNNSPLIKIEKIDLTIFRNDSKSSLINYIILGLVLINFGWLIIHIRKRRI